jgi:tRNA 2-selenouridine synthase
MQVISIEQALKLESCLFVDTRSPSEFEHGHIPGAVNVPLLQDDERAIVGTLYKQRGPEEAKKKGLEIVSGKLADMVQRVSSLTAAAPSAPLVVYCWRGGMRSGSVLTILELMGISGSQLIGGYKSYRRHVQEQLAGFQLRPTVVVLCGSTGVGKTSLLQLIGERGHPVIDLEHLANHRGSAFGQVGRGKPATAQNFDAQLLRLLVQYNEEPFLVVECESKRVGNVYLPEVLFQAMKSGRRILTRASMATRVERLIIEYTDVLIPNDPEILQSINSLQKRLGRKQVAQLTKDYETGNLAGFTKALLSEYYDPLYAYETASADLFDLVVDAEDLNQAAEAIAKYIDRLKGGK